MRRWRASTAFPSCWSAPASAGNKYRNKRVFAWLRKLARNRSVLGGVGTGAYALARAGLLDGYRCTIHWEEFENFSREFPHLRLTADLFEIDRDRMTCPGGTASLDMVFHLVEQQHGRDLAWEIADEFIQHRVRSAHDPQRMSLQSRTRVNDVRLLSAISAMEKSLEDPLTLKQICRISGLSLRHLAAPLHRGAGQIPYFVLPRAPPAAGAQDADAWYEIDPGRGRGQWLRLRLAFHPLLPGAVRPPAPGGALALRLRRWRWRHPSD